MVRGVITAGLLIIAAAFFGLIVVDTEMGGDHDVFLTKAIYTGAGIAAAGLGLAALVKVATIRIGRRCPRCKHVVRPGHVYCEDHFQEAINRARDHTARR